MASTTYEYPPNSFSWFGLVCFALFCWHHSVYPFGLCRILKLNVPLLLLQFQNEYLCTHEIDNFKIKLFFKFELKQFFQPSIDTHTPFSNAFVPFN